MFKKWIGLKRIWDERRKVFQSIVRTKDILLTVLTIERLSLKAVVMELWENVIGQRLREETRISENHLYQAGQQWKQYALREDWEEVKYGTNRNRLESFRAEKIVCQCNKWQCSYYYYGGWSELGGRRNGVILMCELLSTSTRWKLSPAFLWATVLELFPVSHHLFGIISWLVFKSNLGPLFLCFPVLCFYGKIKW